MFVEHKEVGEQQPTRELDEVSKLMLETAAHIERVGLSRDGTEDWCGRPCTIHALNTTSKGRYDLADEAQQRLRDNLGHPIGRWSDATPQGEVVAKLRAVALGG